MWELDSKESWALKSWCFWTLVLEKTLESPLDCQEIKPVNPKGNEFWIFIGRTGAEAETLILWPPDAKNWHLKRPWCWELLKAGERDNRGWDSWMAWLTQWTWVWVNTWIWWWTVRPGVLQSWGHRVGHDWVTELNWTEQRGEWLGFVGEVSAFWMIHISLCFSSSYLTFVSLSFLMCKIRLLSPPHRNDIRMKWYNVGKAEFLVHNKYLKLLDICFLTLLLWKKKREWGPSMPSETQ